MLSREQSQEKTKTRKRTMMTDRQTPDVTAYINRNVLIELCLPENCQV